VPFLASIGLLVADMDEFAFSRDKLNPAPTPQGTGITWPSTSGKYAAAYNDSAFES